MAQLISITRRRSMHTQLFLILGKTASQPLIIFTTIQAKVMLATKTQQLVPILITTAFIHIITMVQTAL